MQAEQPSASQPAGPGAASEDSFQLLFDANPVPMWIWDHETYCFLAVNDTALFCITATVASAFWA
jgi:hypothetical protein